MRRKFEGPTERLAQWDGKYGKQLTEPIATEGGLLLFVVYCGCRNNGTSEV
jgi:hypothetical protein